MIYVTKDEIHADGDLSQVMVEYTMLTISLAYEMGIDVDEFFKEVKEAIEESKIVFDDGDGNAIEAEGGFIKERISS